MFAGIHSDTTDESLGRRLHEVNRQKAIERALERLRHGLKADWHYLTQDDVVSLRWILGELWSVSTRAEWDTFHFSKMGFDSARQLIGHGDRLRRHGAQRMATLQAARALVEGAELQAGAINKRLEGAAFAAQ